MITPVHVFPPTRRRPPSLDTRGPERYSAPPGGVLGSSAAATIAPHPAAGAGRRPAATGGRNPRCGVEDSKGIPTMPPRRYSAASRAAARAADGTLAVSHWPWPKLWRIIVATPHVQLATSVSRRAPAEASAARGSRFLQHAARRAAVERAADWGPRRDTAPRRCRTARISPIVRRWCRGCAGCWQCGILMRSGCARAAPARRSRCSLRATPTCAGRVRTGNGRLYGQKHHQSIGKVNHYVHDGLRVICAGRNFQPRRSGSATSVSDRSRCSTTTTRSRGHDARRSRDPPEEPLAVPRAAAD